MDSEELTTRITVLSDALTFALQAHGPGIPLATVIGLLECLKMDARDQLMARFNAAPDGELH